MQNIVEFLIIFDLCLFFTVFSFILQTLTFRLVFRFLTMLTWFVLALFWSGLTDPLVPAFGWFFYILGFTFLLVLLHDVWMAWKPYWDKRQWGEM